MNLIKVLFLGDVVGSSGCRSLQKYLPTLREQLNLDLIIANVENAAPNGRGITVKTYNDLFSFGVDIMTSGNHVFFHKEICEILDRETNIIRPLNYPDTESGRGITIFKLANSKNFVVLNAMEAALLPNKTREPLPSLLENLNNYSLKESDVAAILVDFHGNSAFEKSSIAHGLDSKVSAVLGTHTHVPSADYQILPGGTAFQTDVGMCGDYLSINGIESTGALEFYNGNIKRSECIPADKPATLCGTYIEIKEDGFAHLIKPIRLGGHLDQVFLD